MKPNRIKLENKNCKKQAMINLPYERKIMEMAWQYGMPFPWFFFLGMMCCGSVLGKVLHYR